MLTFASIDGEGSDNGSPIEISPYQTVVKIIGAGGGGNNTLNRLSRKFSKNAQTVAINTDAQNLMGIHADKKILIGRNITAGLGSGGDPEVGERSAEESKELLKNVIAGTDILFLTGGLGGGTGTGSLPVCGKIAREQGTMSIAIVTMPFSEEGMIRWENAQIGLDKLKKNVDSVIVLRNDRLFELFPDLPLLEAFRKGDEVLVHALDGLMAMILQQGLINLDFADISMVLRDGPSALIGVGESNTENRAEEAASRAIRHPMMDEQITGAQSALVYVNGGEDMTLKEARSVVHTVSKSLDPSARIIWGVNIDKSLNQSMRVMIFATGLKSKAELQRREIMEEFNETPKVEEARFEPDDENNEPVEAGDNIFDIKESILQSSPTVSVKSKPQKPITETTLLFYKIFEEEASSDLKRFDRALHLLRRESQNHRALIDAKQSCKLLLASAQMFGFDEIGKLLESIQNILVGVQDKRIHLNDKLLDSLTLAMEMVVDLMENKNDGRGETGYVVERLRELKNEQVGSASNDR